jgi:hypothetical protein
MSLVTIQGNASGTGTLTVAAPNTNSNYTLTLPAATGTLISTASTFAGTGPAFFVRLGTGQTITLATETKIQLNTDEFDTNSNFDTSTYRFTPTVAGYYQISAGLRATGATTNTSSGIIIYKNGSSYVANYSQATNITQYPTISSLIYMNGSTDYIEFYGTVTGSGTASFGTSAAGAYATWASGCLVRSA